MNKHFNNKRRIYCKDTGEICFGYKNYLKSQHWAFMRSRIIQSHPYCEICKSSEKPLQVHHLSYKRLGNEKDSDLIPLCDKCHAAIHKMEKSDAVKLIRSKSKNLIAENVKSKPKRKTCKGCIFYKRNEKSKSYYCRRKHSRTTGNSNACADFKSPVYLNGESQRQSSPTLKSG